MLPSGGLALDNACLSLTFFVLTALGPGLLRDTWSFPLLERTSGNPPLSLVCCLLFSQEAQAVYLRHRGDGSGTPVLEEHVYVC